MRAPHRFVRDAGWGAFLTLNLTAGGNVLTALAHPWLFCFVAIDIIAPLMSGGAAQWPSVLHGGAIIAGYVATGVIGVWGLARRNKLRLGWALLLTPFYWTCLSVAAWRAVWQFVTDPYRWEKTEHGLVARPRPKRAYTAFAAARPAVRPENRQPPRKVPSSER